MRLRRRHRVIRNTHNDKKNKKPIIYEWIKMNKINELFSLLDQSVFYSEKLLEQKVNCN